MKKLGAPTAVMLEAMAAMEEAGALIRFQGGFWAKPTAPRDHNGVPAGSFGTNTIEGCVRRGLARYTEHRRGRGGDFPIRAEVVKELGPGALK